MLWNLLYSHVVISHTASSCGRNSETCTAFFDGNNSFIATADFTADQFVRQTVTNFFGNEPILWARAELWIVPPVTQPLFGLIWALENNSAVI